MANIISHTGIIDSISHGVVHVRIVQSSACHDCKIASHCSSAESKEKIVDVFTPNASAYNVGQEVTVMAAAMVGAKAVVLAFIIPTALILAVVMGIINFGLSDLTAAISGLLSLVPYYILLYVFEDKIRKQMVFYMP